MSQLNAKVWGLIKFFSGNINDYEFEEYNKLKNKIPKSLRESFAEIYGVKHNGNNYLIQEIVKDYDGRISKTLGQIEEQLDNSFWNRLKNIEMFLLDNNIQLYDQHSKNIMSKKISESEYIPVIINYKKMGIRTYIPQLWIFSKRGRINRTKKEFRRLYKHSKI